MCLSCHVVSVDIHIKDMLALENACTKLGYTVHQNTPHKWYGRWMDDSPVPRHLFDRQSDYDTVVNMPRDERKKYMTALLKTTAHSIEVPGQNYTIGLVRSGDHYRLAWDSWQNTFSLDAFTQTYAVEATRLEAYRNGHCITESTLSDGSVQLRIQVGG